MKFFSHLVTVVLVALFSCLAWILVKQEDSESVVNFLIEGPTLIFNLVMSLFS